MTPTITCRSGAAPQCGQQADSRPRVIAADDLSALTAALENVQYDGGTQLGAIGPIPGAEKPDFYLLFTDGISNFGSRGAGPAGCPALHLLGRRGRQPCLSARLADEQRRPLLQPGQLERRRHLRPGGAAGLVVPLGRRSTAGKSTDLYPQRPQPLAGRFTLVGKLTGETATVTADYGIAGGKSDKQTFKVSRSDAASGSLLRRLWAGKKLAELMIHQKRNEHEIAALGKKFGLVTPYTSLLVLDSLEQYVQLRDRPAQVARRDAGGVHAADRHHRAPEAEAEGRQAEPKSSACGRSGSTGGTTSSSIPRISSMRASRRTRERAAACAGTCSDQRRPADNAGPAGGWAASPPRRGSADGCQRHLQPAAAARRRYAGRSWPPAGRRVHRPGGRRAPLAGTVSSAHAYRRHDGDAELEATTQQSWLSTLVGPPRAIGETRRKRRPACAGQPGHRHPAVESRHAVPEGIAGGQGQGRAVGRLHEEPRPVRHFARLLPRLRRLLRRQAMPEMALQVLSNIAELELEDAALLRVLGHRLVQIGAAGPGRADLRAGAGTAARGAAVVPRPGPDAGPAGRRRRSPLRDHRRGVPRRLRPGHGPLGPRRAGPLGRPLPGDRGHRPGGAQRHHSAGEGGRRLGSRRSTRGCSSSWTSTSAS